MASVEDLVNNYEDAKARVEAKRYDVARDPYYRESYLLAVDKLNRAEAAINEAKR